MKTDLTLHITLSLLMISTAEPHFRQASCRV